ncbi:MAG: hypothetical protein KME03_13950 [Aphanocapsa lilacina HA4352-LM1]|jgi:hypothetical protein|nr:hypothetical protein [Aphanocapsa lilacina HA4352-LM1]
MDRPKLVAIVTGALALALGIGYLVLVQLLDFRTFEPAPTEETPPARSRPSTP